MINSPRVRFGKVQLAVLRMLNSPRVEFGKVQLAVLRMLNSPRVRFHSLLRIITKVITFTIVIIITHKFVIFYHLNLCTSVPNCVTVILCVYPSCTGNNYHEKLNSILEIFSIYLSWLPTVNWYITAANSQLISYGCQQSINLLRLPTVNESIMAANTKFIYYCCQQSINLLRLPTVN